MTQVSPRGRRVALVTGAAHGIGEATVRELAAGGDAVVAGDIDRSAVVDLVAGLSRAGLTCESLAVDVTDATQVDRVVDATVEGFGQLDVLVINAGIGGVATKRGTAAGGLGPGSST